ncbi:MAG: oligosaccharide flippase family protein [Nanoarchaeota archaeon]|nr:oligosaccharide flippase family protein [Nanoarchaeota archaeon]
MVSKIGSLIFTIIVARILFPKMFGIYSLALTIIIILITISDMGFGGSIILFLAESIGHKKKKQARSRFWFLLKLKFAIAIIFSAGLFLSAGIIATLFKKPDLIIPLKIGSFYLLVNSLYGIINPIFLSVQKLKYSAMSELIFQLSRIGLIMFFFFLLKLPSNVQSIFLFMVLSAVVAIIFAAGVLVKKYPFLVSGKTEPVERRRMLKFSSIIALSALGILIFTNIDKIVLGFYLEAEFIGFYAAIMTVVSGVMGIIGISAVFFPIFIQLEGNRLKNAFKKSFHYIALVTFPVSIGLAFVILPMLKILYGVSYVPPQYEFALAITSTLLSLLILESIFSGFYKLLFDAKEKPHVPAYINITTSIANIILNIIFITYLIKIDLALGLVGAALATFITRFGGLVTLVVLSKRRLGISPNISSVIKPLIASLIMLGYLFLFTKLFSLNILMGVFMILSAGILYLLIIFLIKGIDLEELRNLIDK